MKYAILDRIMWIFPVILVVLAILTGWSFIMIISVIGTCCGTFGYYRGRWDKELRNGEEE
jgi:hypothetical protein